MSARLAPCTRSIVCVGFVLLGGAAAGVVHEAASPSCAPLPVFPGR